MGRKQLLSIIFSTFFIFCWSFAEAAPPPLEPPSNLTATAVSSSRINLTWQNNSTRAKAFEIWRYQSSTGWGVIDTVGASTTSYASTGLAASTTYVYMVRAWKSDAYSTFSNNAWDTTFGLAAPPTAPDNLTATAVSSSQINLTWRDNSTNESFFEIWRYQSSTGWGVIDTVSANTTSYASTGLAASTTYVYMVRAYNSAGYSTYSNNAWDATLSGTPPPPPAAPSVNTGSASGTTATSATLNGTVDPNGSTTTAYFQYGTTTGYGGTTSAQNVGSGTAAVAIPGGSIGGLTCNSTYHYRAVGANAGGTRYGSDMTLTTSACPATPPAVTTGSASGTTATSATLNGTVDPNGATTTAYFQYGTTTSYGSTTASQGLGSGTNAVSAAASISGLNSQTTYHFRLVATNSGGTTYGADSTFTTTAAGISVSITSPTSGTTYTTAQTVTISASAAESGGTISRVEFLDNGSVVASDTTSPYSYSWAITSANNGTHNWTARAYDATGNAAVSAAVSLIADIAPSAGSGTIWAEDFGGARNDAGASVSVDAGGNIIAVGTFTGTADLG
ncbi:MAG: fibronectin type III domain-containing protein, partial [Candidatus Sulfobium sp.]